MSSAGKASEVVALLDLKPHPDGGFYSETLRDYSVIVSKSQLPPRYKVDRPVSTAIYFLLPTGSNSYLHRIPCEKPSTFTWENLTVLLINQEFELHDNGQTMLTILGQDLEAGQKLQHSVPPNVWFSSFPTPDIESCSTDGSGLVKAPSRDPELCYSLVGITCAPAFQFEDSEVASFEEVINLAPNSEPLLRYLVRPPKSE